MYTLLLVDDEDIEREGMAELTPWESCGVRLVGTAWNGVEGCEKIATLRPDIVITDIKMPVMDGIGLIRKGRELSEDTVYVVLSGYGEYEFTSQAMELGVRHYILKPCDEEKILSVLEKVTRELDQRRRKEESERRVRRLIPRAREQLFANVLLKKEAPEGLCAGLAGGEAAETGILAFRPEEPLDYLEEFALTNILAELLGKERLLLNATVDGDPVYLLDASVLPELEPIVQKAEREFYKVKPVRMQAAVSAPGKLREIPFLCGEARSLLKLAGAKELPAVLSSRFLYREENKDLILVDCERLRQAERYEDVLFECYLAYVKMRMSGFDAKRMREVFERCIWLLCRREFSAAPESGEWELVSCAAELLFDGKEKAPSADIQKMKPVFLAVYRNIRNQELSIKYLAREVLYMNEDYLGRIFLRYRREKYSAYLSEIRIRLAQRLISFRPDIRIAELAAQCGYPGDGQYFAKAFKKYCGLSPSEYREQEKQKRQE